MILKVARMGHPVLRARAAEVARGELESGAIAALVRDLEETMLDYDGVGLAAPQVHVSKRVVIVEVPAVVRGEEGVGVPRTAMINPVVRPLTDTLMETWEGCLSIPELIGLVPRPRQVHVAWTGLDGEPYELTLEGFPAAVIQHEVDHLDGVLYIDRIKDIRTLQFSVEFARYAARPNRGPAGGGAGAGDED